LPRTLNLFFPSPSHCVRLCLSLSPLSLSLCSFLPLSHISVSFCFSYLLCPSLAPPVPRRVPGSRLFLRYFFFNFLPLGRPPPLPPLITPHSFRSHFVFHLNTFPASLFLTHAHASSSRLDGSGRSPPPVAYSLLPYSSVHRVVVFWHYVTPWRSTLVYET